MFRVDRIASFTPARKPFQICLMSTHLNSDVDFCNGAKLRCADFEGGPSHIG